MRSLLLIPLLSLTASSAFAADAKVAYVDMAQALNEVSDAKTAKDKLKREFDAKQKKLDKMQKDLKAKKDAFDKKAGTMKPEARALQQEELQREFMSLQQTYMQLQQELMETEQNVTKEIAVKLQKIIERIGDRESYDIILNIGDTVLYFKRHQEITSQVVREYNKEYGKK